MVSADLFEPFPSDDLALAKRMVMAPATRNCANRSGVVPPMPVTYDQQRGCQAGYTDDPFCLGAETEAA
jgi:2,4-dienoyl-CoA reductase-like NADH-dependent reductase (Old Yellow Enzyme family)